MSEHYPGFGNTGEILIQFIIMLALCSLWKAEITLPVLQDPPVGMAAARRQKDERREKKVI